MYFSTLEGGKGGGLDPSKEFSTLFFYFEPFPLLINLSALKKRVISFFFFYNDPSSLCLQYMKFSDNFSLEFSQIILLVAKIDYTLVYVDVVIFLLRICTILVLISKNILYKLI